MKNKYSAGIDSFFALEVIQLFEDIYEMKPNNIMHNERDNIFNFFYNDKQTLFIKKKY